MINTEMFSLEKTVANKNVARNAGGAHMFHFSGIVFVWGLFLLGFPSNENSSQVRDRDHCPSI